MLIEKGIHYILYLKQCLGKSNKLWYLILPLQSLTIILLLLIKQLKQIIAAQQFQSIQNIFKQLYTGFILEIIITTAFTISILIIILCAIYMKLKQKFNQFEYNQAIQNKIIIASAILVWIYEIFLSVIIIALKLVIIQGARQQINSKIYLEYLTPFVIVVTLLVILLNQHIRVYGYKFILVPIFLTGYWDNQNYMVEDQAMIIITLISMILLTVLEIWNDEKHQFLMIKGKNFRIILHCQIIGVLVWKLSWAINPSLKVQIINFINLAVIQLFITLAVIFSKYQRETKTNNFKKLCELVMKLEKDIINSSEKYLMIELCVKILHDKDDPSIGDHLFKISKKSIIDWAVEDWVIFMNDVGEYKFSQDPSLINGITILKGQLVYGQKITKSLLFFQRLVKKYYFTGVSNKYEIVKIALKLYAFYFKKHEASQYSYVSILSESNRLKDQFYSEIQKILQNYESLWNLIQSNEFSKTYEDITSIIENFQRAKKICRNNEQFSSFAKQNTMLNFLDNLLFNRISDDTHPQKNELKSQSQEFIEIRNGQIGNISTKLAYQLNYQKYQIQGESIEKIIQPYFYQRINEKIESAVTPVVELFFSVPIFKSNGSFLLRTITSYFHLDVEDGYTLFLHFSKAPVSRAPLLLIELKRKSIKGYNDIFINQFEISEALITNFISKNLLMIQDIIQMPNKHQLLQDFVKSSTQQFNCSLNVQKIKKKTGQGLIFNARVSVIQTYGDYLLVKASQGPRLKSMMMVISQEEKQINAENEKQIQDQTKFSEFCPIENPYKRKILNLKQSLRKSKYLSVTNLILIFFSLTFLLNLISIIFSTQMNNVSEHQFQGYMQKKQKIYSEIIILYEAYEIFYLRQIFKSYADSLQPFNINSAQLSQALGTKLSQKIQQFSKKYVIHNTQGTITDQNYQQKFSLMFEDFEFQINPNGLNFIDYASKFLMYDKEQSLTFLLKNYQTFRDTWKFLRQHQANFQSIEKKQDAILNIVSLILLVLMMITLAISIFLLGKLKTIILDIENLFKMVDHSEISRNRQKIQIVSQNVASVQLKNRQMQQDSLQQVSLNTKMYFSSKKLITTDILEQQRDEVQEISESPRGSDKSIVNLNLIQQKKQSIRKQESQQATNLIGKFLFFYILFYSVILGAIGYEYYTILTALSKMREDYSQILGFMTEQKVIFLNILEQEIDTLHYYLTNEKLENEQFIQLTGQKKTLNHLTLPYSKASYIDQYFERNSADLCIVAEHEHSNQFQYFDIPRQLCSQILGGILREGVSKTETLVSNQLIKVQENGIQYGFQKANLQQYPLLFQLSFSIGLIKDLFFENAHQFHEWFEQFEREHKFNNKMWFLTQLGALILYLIIVIFIVRGLKKQSEIAVCYFLIISNQALLESKFLKYLREKMLLKRVALL